MKLNFLAQSSWIMVCSVEQTFCFDIVVKQFDTSRLKPVTF